MRDDQQTDVLERIIHEFSPSSIRMEVTFEQFMAKNGSVGSKPDMTIERTYIETSKGERSYEEIQILPGTDTTRTKYFSDGKKLSYVFYKPGDTSKVAAAGEERDFRREVKWGYYEAPEPFRYSRVGMTPLQDVLPNARKLGETEVIGRPCDQYFFEEVKIPGGASQSLVYTLDRATSVPLKVAAYRDARHLDNDRPTWVWEALSLDTINNHHFPLKSQYQEYLWSQADQDHTTQLHFKEFIEVKSIEYDASYPATMFWPKAEIAESEAMEKAALTSAPTPVTQVANPIRVDPNGESWPMWPGLVLSGVLLIAALIVRIRTR